MRAEEFDELYGAFADGPCSPEDVERLLEAIDSDPELLSRFLAERDLEHLLGRMLRPEATDSAFLRGVLRDSSARPLTPQEFEERVLQKANVPGAAPVRRSFVPRIFRRRYGRTPGSGGVLALLAAGLLLGIATLVVVLSSGGRPATRRESEARLRPAPDAERLQKAREEVAEAEREQQRMRERLERIDRAREELVKAQPRPEEKPDPAREEERRNRLAQAQDEKQRIEAEMRQAVERAHQAREALAHAESAAPQPAKEPAPEATVAGMAVLERAEGDVSVLGKAGKRPAKAGESLRSGEGIETAGASRAVLTFPDATRVDVAAESIVAEVSADRGKRVLLSRGALAAGVTQQPRGQAMVFRTPHGDATVLGTTLRLVVDPHEPGSTRLAVDEGRVHFKNAAGKAVEVLTGHSAVAASGVTLAAVPFVLFSDGFESGQLAGWRWNPGYDVWRAIKDPAGQGKVLTGGTWASAKPGPLDRYSAALRCGRPTWTDYAVEASVRFEKIVVDRRIGVCGVLLLARVQEAQNSCYWLEFSYFDPPRGTSVIINKFSKGSFSNLASVKVAMPEAGRWYRLRFEVQGARLRGYLDGRRVAEAEDSDSPAGGVGLTRADPDGADIPIVWDNIRIEALDPSSK